MEYDYHCSLCNRRYTYVPYKCDCTQHTGTVIYDGWGTAEKNKKKQEEQQRQQRAQAAKQQQQIKGKKDSSSTSGCLGIIVILLIIGAYNGLNDGSSDSSSSGSDPVPKVAPVPAYTPSTTPSVEPPKEEKSSYSINGYKIFQQLALNTFYGSNSATLYVLVDEKLTSISGSFRTNEEENIITPDFGTNFELNGYAENELNKAIVVAVDENGETIFTEKLDRYCARIDEVMLDKLTICLTVDYSAGMGSYNGPVSYFLSVNANDLEFLFEKTGFMTSLKRGWRLNYTNGRPEIWYTKCDFNPDASNESENFITQYIHYYKEDGEWKFTTTKEFLMWENESY